MEVINAYQMAKVSSSQQAGFTPSATRLTSCKAPNSQREALNSYPTITPKIYKVKWIINLAGASRI